MYHLDFRLRVANRILSNAKIYALLLVVFSIFSVAATAQNFTVTSNGDTHAVTPTTSALDAGGQITLRSACEASTQIAGTHIITIPGSITSITLTLGQITIGSAAVGNNITINGGGKAVLTIRQSTVNRIFFTGAGAVTFNLNDVTLTYIGPVGSIGGGGGAIIAGGVNANTTLTNVAITNFNIQSGNGGAVLCSTANTNNFTATNCDFDNNTAGGGGGAVSIVTNSTANFTNCNFTNNKTGTVGASFGGSGGALLTSGTGNGGTYNVTNCTFTNNQSQNATPQTGGACFNTNGTLNLTFCRFVGNTVSGGGAGQTLGQAGGATVQNTVANNNWWGVNSGPDANATVVLAAGGTITTTKWLQLKTTINVNPLCTGGSATVTASFLSNNLGEAVTVANISKLIGLPISFANPTLGAHAGAQAFIQAGGTATTTFTAGGTSGAGSINAVVDNIPNNDVAPAKVSFTINPGAAVTGNPSNTTVCTGANANFTASFSGTPTPTIQWQVSTNGGGVYNNIVGATTSPLTFATVAGDNGKLYRAVGTNTCGSANTTGALLTVNVPPAVTGNPSNQSVPSGSNASFTASFSGSPTPTLQWQVSTNGGGVYNNIAGATSSPLVFVTNLSQSGNLYRCVGTNTCSSINTTGALLTVTNACATSSVIAVSGASSICNGQTGNIKVTITGGASPFTVVYNNGLSNVSVPGYVSGTNIPVSPTTTTTYTLTSVTDANSCVGSGNSGSATITVNPAITAGITNNSGSTLLTCSLTAISVTATGGTTYLWDGGATPNTAANSFSSPGTYNVTVTGAGGCNAPAQITITQNITPPTAGITNNSGSTVLTCSLTSISVTATGGVSYSWNGGSTPNTAANSFSSPGTYTVTVTGANGCTSQAQITITQNITPPTAGITNNTGTTQLDCTITSINVTATGGVSYSWNGGATPNTAANSFSSPGTYTVTVTGANGCTAQAQITITQSVTPPTAGITNNSGSTVLTCSLTSISVTATGGVSYSWNGGATPNTAANSFSSPGTYTVTVTAAGGCTAQAQITITQNITPPTAGITNNTGTTQLDCTITSISVTATGGISYSWNGGTTPNTAANSFNSPGTYTVTVTGANGCTSQAQITITQSVTPPTAGITNNSGSTVLTCSLTSISVTATGGISYSWDGGATPNTAANSFNSPGTYTVTVTAAGGCTAQAQITITQNITPPTAGITNNTGTTQLDCTITSISVTATGGVSYSWNGGTTPNTAANSFNSPGTYTVTVTGANGCTSQAQITITQSVTPPTAGITNNSGSTVLTCSLTSISVTATGGISYSWDGGATPNTAANSFSSPGTYTVTVTAAGGCTAQAQITITQNITPPTAGITNNTGTTQLGCGVTSISVTATGGVSYSWDGGSTPNTAANSFNAPGTYTVIVTGVNGCTSQAQVTISVNPGTPAAPGPFSGTVNVCVYVGTGIQLTYSVPAVPGSTYAWVVPSTVNIVSGQGTNSIVVTLSNGFVANANKQLRLTATNACGTSPLAIYYLLAQAPNTPAAIQATGVNVCPIIGTLNTYTYTITSVIGAASYLWIAGSGATINHTNGAGVNDTTVTVNFANGFANSNITVQSVNGCGTSNPRSIPITANAPAPPSPIAGPTNACEFIAPNGVPATYSVNNDPGNTYNWTVPLNVIGLTGQGTNSISFTYPNGFTSGTVSVSATNGCGTGAPRSLTVTKLNAATPGMIDMIQLNGCPNRLYSFTISALPANATSLQWTVPVGATIQSQTTTGISVSFPASAVNGQVTVKAVNNCSNSSIRSIAVKLPSCVIERENATRISKSAVTLPSETVMTVNVFPNPAVNNFNLEVSTPDKGLIHVRVSDLQGRNLKSMTILPYESKSFGADLKPGAYILEIRQGNKTRITRIIRF